jgi:predicted ATP-grasp superfamily ATP-dependent carboligase
MRSNSRASLSEPKSILIAAASGRALAAAARRSGYRPLVVDFFGDEDTRALAAKTRRVRDPDRGFAAAELLALLRDLADGEAPRALVYGSGFEDRPKILEAVAQTFAVFGNSAPMIARAKNPRALAALCADFKIRHPDIAFDPPDDPGNWLIKRRGGGGGVHIRAAKGPDFSADEYFQRRVAGEPVSVLLLGDGHKSQVLGTSSQWTACSPDTPFRFGGAVRPAQRSAEQLTRLSVAAQKVSQALHVVGLNSVDFLVEADEFHLVEVNPRPGATLDIFADEEGAIFAAHLEACRGYLPARPLVFRTAAATAIAYAPCELTSMPALVWPDWCKDRQRPGTFLRAGDPVCTISAEADTADAAHTLVNARCVSFEEGLLREAHKECIA